jgi:hypothetical protein
MINCQNCSNKCFEHTSGKCVTYNGESFPDVNVIQNNNVESVIEGLAKATSDLKSFVEECSACNGTSNEKIVEADFSYVSSKSVTSNYHEITVETKPSEKDISLLYSIPELPSDAQVISSDIRINGKKNGYTGEIYSSSNLNDGITLQPDNFPATLNSKIKVLTKDGEKLITSNVDLDPSGKVSTTSFTNEIYTQSKPSTQDEFNKLLLTRLENLESSFKNISKISTSSFTGTIQEAILNIYSKIATLENCIKDLTSLNINTQCDECGTSQTSAPKALEDLYSKYCQLSGLYTSNRADISRLGEQVRSNTQLIVNTGSTSGTGTSSGSGTNSGGSSSGGSGGSGGSSGGGGNEGGSGGNNLPTYTYCCTGAGCKKQLASLPCTGSSYPTLDECTAECSIISPPTGSDPTSTGPCDVIILYNHSSTCSNPTGNIEAAVNNLNNNFTYTKADYLTGGSNCAYNIKAICGTNKSTIFKTNLYSGVNGLASNIKTWVETNCPCQETGSDCDTIKNQLTIIPKFGTGTVYFEVTKSGTSFQTSYERISKTKVSAPNTISISDLSAGDTFSVEFSFNLDGKTCTFIKDFTVPSGTDPCTGFSINTVTYSSPVLTVNLTGGTGPFIYKVDGIVINISNVTLAVGSHTLLVTDSKGCEVNKTFNVATVDNNCIAVSTSHSSYTNIFCDNDIYPVEYKKVIFTIQNPLSTNLVINFEMKHTDCNNAITYQQEEITIGAGNLTNEFIYQYDNWVLCPDFCKKETLEFGKIVSNSKNYSKC